MDGFDSILATTAYRISDMKDKPLESTQSREQEEKGKLE